MIVNETFTSSMDYLNASEVTGLLVGGTTPRSKDHKAVNHLFVYGYPGVNFYIVHISALISLGISVIISFGLLIHLLRAKLWSRTLGERLVVYLAINDLLFSLSHTLDHSTMLALRDHPPDLPCSIMAFFVFSFVSSQLIIVLFIAANAFCMVVLERKVEFGKHDWKLLSVSFGVPCVCGTILAALGFLGPGGQWCLGDVRKTRGIIINNVLAVTMVVVFIFNSVSYLGIWMKVRKVSRAAAGSSGDQGKYHKSAKIMLLFIAAYITQYWAYLISCVWDFFGEVPVVIIVGAVTFSNMGGLFNFLAYTYIRKKQASVQNGTSTSSQVNNTSVK